MQFIKHVGRHQDRKIAVLFRQVPGEDHMALIIYPEVLPAAWHDSIMKVLESDIGQQAEELADALHRSYLPDGRPVLQTLHEERMIKKVRTADVIMVPRPDSSIRLDELNKMLNEMKLGEDAVKRMAQADATRGLVDAPTKRAAEQAFKDSRQPVMQAPQDGALSDRDIAANMLAQAEKMEIEARNMIAEASRMKKDAERMDPHVVAREAPPTEPAPPRRGRPPKTQAVADATR